jgi:hypothetical protein
MNNYTATGIYFHSRGSVITATCGNSRFHETDLFCKKNHWYRWLDDYKKITNFAPELNIFVENGKKIDYRQLENITDAILNGQARLDSLFLGEETGRTKGGRRNVEASVLLATDQCTNKSIYREQKSYRLAERQEKLLKQYARQNKIWFKESDIAAQALEEFPQGTESHVYLDRDNKHVIKIVNYLVMNELPLDYLNNRITLHNYLFEDTFYELIGFTENEDGFAFAVRQPFVQGRDLRKDEFPLLDTEMLKLGFKKAKWDYSYFNDDYIVMDLNKINVLVSENGNFRFIDTVPLLNTENEKLGGTREYGEGKIIPIDENNLTININNNEIT